MSFRINLRALSLLFFLSSISIGSVFKLIDISILDELLLFISVFILLFISKDPSILRISRASEYFNYTLFILLTILLFLGSVSVYPGSLIYLFRILSVFLGLFIIGSKLRLFTPQGLVVNFLDIFIILLGLISAIIPIANIILELPAASWQDTGIVGTSFHAPLLAFCYPLLSKKYRPLYSFFVLLFGVFAESRLAIIFSGVLAITNLAEFGFNVNLFLKLQSLSLYMVRYRKLVAFLFFSLGFLLLTVYAKIAFDLYFEGISHFFDFMARTFEYVFLYLDFSNITASDSDRLEHLSIGIQSVGSSFYTSLLGHGIHASREVLGIRLTGFSRILYDQGFLFFLIISGLQFKNLTNLLYQRKFIAAFCFSYALFSFYFFTDPMDSVIYYAMAFPVFKSICVFAKD